MVLKGLLSLDNHLLDLLALDLLHCSNVQAFKLVELGKAPPFLKQSARRYQVHVGVYNASTYSQCIQG